MCTRLVAELEPADGYADDVAVVAVRPVGVTPDTFVQVLHAAVGELSAFRARMREWLHARGLDASDNHRVLLAVSEALNNAIEHGSQHDPARRVVVEAFADRPRLSASVSDGGRWDADSAASRRRAERGRASRSCTAWPTTWTWCAAGSGPA